MWHRLWKPSVIVLPWAAFVLAVLYIAYRLVDPLPPRHLAIAAGAAGSGYDNFARQYALILARHGVELEVRNRVPHGEASRRAGCRSAGAVENLDLLRDTASGVQAALATFGVTQPLDASSARFGADDVIAQARIAALLQGLQQAGPAESRAASGHAATAPPSSVMNERRFIQSPRRRARAASAVPRDRVSSRS
jgi:hypothetical protein